MATTPLKIFIIYSREDEQFKKDLQKHLLPLERNGEIDVWSDREILAGEEWDAAIKQQLKTANVILPLISSNYFFSDYIHEVEIKEALQRHENGEVIIVPIIVGACIWESDPTISKLQVLPKDGRPVELWSPQSSAYTDVVRGLKPIFQKLKGELLQHQKETKVESLPQNPTGVSVPIEPKFDFSKIRPYFPYLLLAVIISVAAVAYNTCQPELGNQPEGENLEVQNTLIKTDSPPTNETRSGLPEGNNEGKPSMRPSPLNTDSVAEDTMKNKGVGTGRYIVQAGRFRGMTAVQARISELAKVGYPNCEILKYGSNLTVVIVLRTDDKAKAIQTAEELKKLGLDGWWGYSRNY